MFFQRNNRHILTYIFIYLFVVTEWVKFMHMCTWLLCGIFVVRERKKCQTIARNMLKRHLHQQNKWDTKQTNERHTPNNTNTVTSIKNYLFIDNWQSFVHLAFYSHRVFCYGDCDVMIYEMSWWWWWISAKYGYAMTWWIN